jgi:hypothetical protein
MKKVLYLSAVVALALTFTSCKHDYTCSCTVTGDGISGTASGNFNATKKDAEEACDGLQSTTSTSYGSSATVKCDLKKN